MTRRRSASPSDTSGGRDIANPPAGVPDRWTAAAAGIGRALSQAGHFHDGVDDGEMPGR